MVALKEVCEGDDCERVMTHALDCMLFQTVAGSPPLICPTHLIHARHVSLLLFCQSAQLLQLAPFSLLKQHDLAAVLSLLFVKCVVQVMVVQGVRKISAQGWLTVSAYVGCVVLREEGLGVGTKPALPAFSRNQQLNQRRMLGCQHICTPGSPGAAGTQRAGQHRRDQLWLLATPCWTPGQLPVLLPPSLLPPLLLLLWGCQQLLPPPCVQPWACPCPS